MIIAGKYEVLGKLGQGGQGTVYKVRHLGLDDIRALKMQPDQGVGEETVTRFRREGKALARLRHAHIVQVFDLGRDADQYYLEMEYVDGPNLAQYLRANGRPPVLDALEIARQIADALTYAHAQPYVDSAGVQHTGMVHRDIKPSNILLRDQTPVYALLADFGLVKLGDPGERTTTGTMLGTYKYSAPEQLGLKRNRERVSVDFRADVFAFGLVLYELLEGRQFHAGLEPQEILARVLFEPDALEPEFTVSVPPGLRALVHRMVQRDPEDRPPNMRVVRAGIEEALSDMRVGDAETVVVGPSGRPSAGEPRTEEELEEQIRALMAERERRRAQSARGDALAARSRALDAGAVELATPEFEAAVRREEEASFALSAGDLSQARQLYELTSKLFADAEAQAAAERERLAAETARAAAAAAGAVALSAGLWTAAEERFTAATEQLAAGDVQEATRAFEGVTTAFRAALSAAETERERRRRAAEELRGVALARRDEAERAEAARHATAAWATACDAVADGERLVAAGDELEAAAAFQRAAGEFEAAARSCLEARAAGDESTRAAAAAEAAGGATYAAEEYAAARGRLGAATATLERGDAAAARPLFVAATEALAAVAELASVRAKEAEARRREEEARRLAEEEARRRAAEERARQLAAVEEVRGAAAAARVAASDAEASRWAPELAGEAEGAWRAGEEAASREAFADARRAFDSAATGFGRAAAISRERAEKERRRAEEERRRQLDAVESARAAAAAASERGAVLGAAELVPAAWAAATGALADADHAVRTDALEEAERLFYATASRFEEAARAATVEMARRRALAAQAASAEARGSAEQAEAERWAVRAWRAAAQPLSAAEAALARDDFDAAIREFAKATAAFEAATAAARTAAEADRRRRAEEEARRQAEEEALRQAEEEARRQAEEEARRKVEEEARRRAEAEARRQAEEESRRQAAAERARLLAAVADARARAAASADRARAADATALAPALLATAEAHLREAEAVAQREAPEEAAQRFALATAAFEDAAGAAIVEAARHRGQTARTQALTAREDALTADAPRWAVEAWRAVEERLAEAEAALAREAFDAAAQEFAAADAAYRSTTAAATAAAAEDRRRREDEARRQAEAEARRRAEEAQARQRAEEDARRRAEEEARRRAEAAEEEARRRIEEELRKETLSAQHESTRAREGAAQAEAARWAVDEWRAAETTRSAAEAALARGAVADAGSGFREAAAGFRSAAGAAAVAAEADQRRVERLAAEEAQRRAREESEARQRAETEARRRVEEDARQRAEDAARRQAEQKARAQEERARQLAAEAEAARPRDVEATIIVPPDAEATLVAPLLDAEATVVEPSVARPEPVAPFEAPRVERPAALPTAERPGRAWWPYAAALVLAMGLGYALLRPRTEPVAPQPVEERPVPTPETPKVPPATVPLAPPDIAWRAVAPPAGDTPAVKEGERLRFEASVATPEAQPGLDVRWLLDGKEVGRGETWEYAPGFAEGGRTRTVEAVATSEGRRLAQSWQVGVVDVDRPPVIASASPAADTITLERGAKQTLSLRASDPDEGDRLTYTWERKGKRVASGPQPELTVADAADGEEIRVTVTDQDGLSAGTRSWKVALKEAPPVEPQPPKIAGQTPSRTRLSVAEGKTVDFSLKVTDPDPKEKLAYAWFVDGRPVGTDKTLRYEAPSLTEQKAAQRIEAEVTDASGLKSGRAAWDVEVQWAAPEVLRLEPRERTVRLEPGQVRELRAGATSPAKGALTYEWRLDGKAQGPSPTGRFQLPSDLAPGTHAVEVASIDPRGLRSDPLGWSVEVRSTPPPTVAIVPPPTTPPSTVVSRLPPPTVPPPPAVERGSLTESDVDDWLGSYRSAWERKDAAALAALGVTSAGQAEDIVRKVSYLREVRVTKRAATVTAGTATVSFDRVDVPDRGPPQAHPTKTCRLQRVGGRVTAVGGCL